MTKKPTNSYVTITPVNPTAQNIPYYVSVSSKSLIKKYEQENNEFIDLKNRVADLERYVAELCIKIGKNV